MGILLAFAPFIVFVIVERLFGVSAGLAAGAVVSAAMLLRDGLTSGRTVKILEVGTVILFGGLTIYAFMTDANWSIAAVRLRVDAGLLIIVLASIALHRPFTLQYAKEEVARDLWQTSRFAHVNYMITTVWAAAFAVMVIADLVMTYATTLPHSVGIVATIVALYAAVKFTAWYPERGQAT
jgi:hypothetical protein